MFCCGEMNHLTETEIGKQRIALLAVFLSQTHESLDKDIALKYTGSYVRTQKARKNNRKTKHMLYRQHLAIFERHYDSFKSVHQHLNFFTIDSVAVDVVFFSSSLFSRGFIS